MSFTANRLRRYCTSQHLRPPLKTRIPNGCLFSPLLKGQQIAYSHPLDNEEEYSKFLAEQLPLAVEDAAPSILGYKERMLEMLKYNVPAFHTCWTFGPELVYKTVVPKERLIDENMKKCRLLRACVDLKFAFTTILDDIADNSDQRKGKPAWKLMCPEGISVAMYDGILLDALPYYILEKYFKGEPGYERLLETFQIVRRKHEFTLWYAVAHQSSWLRHRSVQPARASLKMIIGESLDVTAHKKSAMVSKQTWMEILNYKAGCFLAMQPTLGALLAGIQDEQLIKQIERIFGETGRMIQTWDDFCDYYCTSAQTGKPSCDFQNAGTTWASSTAMEKFSDDQRKTFLECYGSADPEKIEAVMRLYDSVHLPHLYVEFMRERAQNCFDLISDLPHPGLREACTSWLRWLVGDVLDS